jgi:ABC-type polysaccharide/polyol phosphate transport system ATPase subunit
MSAGALRPGEIRVEGASRVFRLRADEAGTLKDLFVRRGRGEATDVQALRDVSLQVRHGEAVGLVGRNGSGKSTLLRLIAGIIKPTSGQVLAEGRIASLLELGAGFHPDFSGRENVFLNGAVHGLSRRQIRERFDEIVAFAELDRFVDQKLKNFSSGMQLRLAYSIAIQVDFDILLLDEVLAVGDHSFQQKCFATFERFRAEGKTMMFVSHDVAAVAAFCERALLLDSGRVRALGPASEVVETYLGQTAESADQALGTVRG